jgi:hypothetical protein
MAQDGLEDTLLFCFWTGDNPLTTARLYSISKMAEITGANVQLVTKDTIHSWEVPESPFHPAYSYLSAVHKADYLRAYFMCHYGGGYTDIKVPTGSWLPAFETMRKDESLWVVGYPESSPSDIAFVNNNELYQNMQSVYFKMIGNGSYICRKGTPLVKEWLTNIHQILDKKLEQLKAFPAPHPRAKFPEDAQYALHWTEICGSVFHPCVYTYLDHVSTSLPKPVCHSYE